MMRAWRASGEACSRSGPGPPDWTCGGSSFHGDVAPPRPGASAALAPPGRGGPGPRPPRPPARALAAGSAPVIATRRVDFARSLWLSSCKYRRPRRVVAASHAVATVLERSGLAPAARPCVVYEGVPDRPSKPGGREALAAMGRPGDALVALRRGGLHPPGRTTRR